jgi:hypothetical protein
LLGVIEFRGAAGLIPEIVGDILEGLFEHGSGQLRDFDAGRARGSDIIRDGEGIVQHGCQTGPTLGRVDALQFSKPLARNLTS